jgi:hypothetical protein
MSIFFMYVSIYIEQNFIQLQIFLVVIRAININVELNFGFQHVPNLKKISDGYFGAS